MNTKFTSFVACAIMVAGITGCSKKSKKRYEPGVLNSRTPLAELPREAHSVVYEHDYGFDEIELKARHTRTTEELTAESTGIEPLEEKEVDFSHLEARMLKKDGTPTNLQLAIDAINKGSIEFNYESEGLLIEASPYLTKASVKFKSDDAKALYGAMYFDSVPMELPSVEDAKDYTNIGIQHGLQITCVKGVKKVDGAFDFENIDYDCSFVFDSESGDANIVGWMSETADSKAEIERQIYAGEFKSRPLAYYESDTMQLGINGTTNGRMKLKGIDAMAIYGLLRNSAEEEFIADPKAGIRGMMRKGEHLLCKKFPKQNSTEFECIINFDYRFGEAEELR